MSALTETLAAHRMIRHPHKHQTVWVAWVKCRCGWEAERVPRDPLHWEEPDLIEKLRVDHEAHVAAVIAETHAIVELPKPWMEGSDAEWTDGIITAHIGSGKVRCYLEDGRMTSDDAREIGAGLIAAAAAADSSEVSS